MSLPRLLNWLIVVFLFVVLWSPSGLTQEESGPLTYLRYAIFAGLGGAIVLLAFIEAQSRRLTLELALGPFLMLAFVGYTILSMVWSDYPNAALLKGGLLAIALLVCLSLATVRSAGFLLTRFVWTGTIFTFAGAVVALALPQIGVETGWLLEGKWRGISGQKNGFGALAAMSLVGVVLLTFGQRDRVGRRAIVLPAILIGLLALCLLMSGSRGAQLICLVGLLAALWVALPQNLQTLGVVLGVILALPIALLGLFSLRVDTNDLSIFGLTFDTSSRTAIWGYGFENFPGRELFGFGLSGFWGEDRLLAFKDNHGWVLDNFHNGYVTVLIEGGIVGLALLLGATVATLVALRRRVARHSSRASVLAFAFFSMLAAHNLIENTAGRSTSTLFILTLVVALAPAAVTSRQRVGERAADLARPPRRWAQVKQGEPG